MDAPNPPHSTSNSATAMSNAPPQSGSGPQQSQPQQSQTASSSTGPSSSSGAQMRSRITVVCAECKRLKLKCDRRTPCGSCAKRNTVERCIYSAAASEKVDVQSLHNRVCTIEAEVHKFNQVLSGRLSLPHSLSSLSSLPSNNDRALIAIGNSGSSVVISLEDVAGIWLEELEIGVDGLVAHLPTASSSSPFPFAHHTNGSSSSSHQPHIKLEPSPPAIPSGLFASGEPSMSPTILLSLPPMSAYFSSSPSSTSQPTVTPSLLSHLPSNPHIREKLLDMCEHVIRLNPCFNWPHFKGRIRALFNTDFSEGEKYCDSTGTDQEREHERAREILYGHAGPSFSTSIESPKSSVPTLSFFAAASAALALGALVWKEEDWEGKEEISRRPVSEPSSVHDMSGTSSENGTGRKRKTKVKGDHPEPLLSTHVIPEMDSACSTDPSFLHALSQQSLSISENYCPYDLDYLVGAILQTLYALHDGTPRISGSIFPVIGKMVNVARMMGLAMDPDEFPGKYSPFEAETRRRIWWDVFYYDTYVSDSMGHVPLIADNSHTTRLPAADVDEDRFEPKSAEVPTIKEEEGERRQPSPSSSIYGLLKVRLAQLVKNIKKTSFRDPLVEPASPESAIEQAAGFEADIKQWMNELPPCFRMDANLDSHHAAPSPFTGSSPATSASSPSESPYLVAQRCELAIVANRLILKVYIPFLRSKAQSSTETRKPVAWHQAFDGTLHAAHSIVGASRRLHSVWKLNRRPAAFVFYSFGRTLFDAAICLCHAVIQQPHAIWSQTALTDVRDSLEIMNDPRVATGRGPVNGGVEGSVSEAVKIVDLMLKKAEGACRGGSVNVNAGSKRKHEDLEVDNTLPAGFQLPYVGPGVTIADTRPPPQTTSNPSRSSQSQAPMPSVERRGSTVSLTNGRAPPTATPDREFTSGRKPRSGSKTSYPSVGIRVRGKEGPPLNRQRQDRGPLSASSSAPVRMPAPPLPSRSSYPVTPVDSMSYPPTPSHPCEEPIFADTMDYAVPSTSSIDSRMDGASERRPSAPTHHGYNADLSSTNSLPMYNHSQDAGPGSGYDCADTGRVQSNSGSPFSTAVGGPSSTPMHPTPPFAPTSTLPIHSQPSPSSSYPGGTSSASFPPLPPQHPYSSNPYPSEGAQNHPPYDNTPSLHTHHMRIMNGGMDGRAMNMDSAGSNTHDRRFAPMEPKITAMPPSSFSLHHGKAPDSHNLPFSHHLDQMSHNPQQPGLSNDVQGWTPNSGVSGSNGYWAGFYS